LWYVAVSVPQAPNPSAANVRASVASVRIDFPIDPALADRATAAPGVGARTWAPDLGSESPRVGPAGSGRVGVPPTPKSGERQDLR
jgi:hypothetical protein